MQFEQS